MLLAWRAGRGEARFFNAECWLNFQNFYDLEVSRRSGKLSEIERQVQPLVQSVLATSEQFETLEGLLASARVTKKKEMMRQIIATSNTLAEAMVQAAEVLSCEIANLQCELRARSDDALLAKLAAA